MQLQDKPELPSHTDQTIVEVGTYREPFYQDAQATFVVPKEPPRRSAGRALL